MRHIFERSDREQYINIYKDDFIYRIIKSSLGKFTKETGKLRLHPIEMFVNFYACVDEYRKDNGEGFLDAGNILYNLRNDIDNDANEIAGLFLRQCRDQDLDNAIVIIGTLLYFYFDAKKEEAASWRMLRELARELFSLNPILYKKCLYAIYRKLGKSNYFHKFKKLMLDYDASDKYLGMTLLNPQAVCVEMSQRNLAPEQEETRRKLREIEGEVDLGLNEEDRDIMLHGVYQVVETGTVGKPSREIATDASQHKIIHLLHKMYKATRTEKKLWLNLIRNYFTAKFKGMTDKTLSSQFRQYPELVNCSRRSA